MLSEKRAGDPSGRTSVDGEKAIHDRHFIRQSPGHGYPGITGPVLEVPQLPAESALERPPPRDELSTKTAPAQPAASANFPALTTTTASAAAATTTTTASAASSFLVVFLEQVDAARPAGFPTALPCQTVQSSKAEPAARPSSPRHEPAPEGPRADGADAKAPHPPGDSETDGAQIHPAPPPTTER